MTTRTKVSTRRDTVLAALGLLAVVMVAAALMALLLSFLSAQAPGLFRPAGMSGHGTVGPAALAASTFPYRHVTVQADTELAGRVNVSFDDGTGQPAAQVVRSLPVDGSAYGSGESSLERCDTNGLCWGEWNITPTLNVTVRTTYQGVECVITGSPTTRGATNCGGIRVPN